MNRRITKILAAGLILTIVVAFSYYRINIFIKSDSCLDHGGRWNYETNKCEPGDTAESFSKPDSTNPMHGYNELANEDSLKVYTISDYNTDLADVENIVRPDQSQIINSTIDTVLLFKIWTLDPNGPHADFRINAKEFYVVDYDGNGAMPYILKRDSLIIYYNDFIQRGRILKVTRDNLIIKWNDAYNPTNYLEWKN